MALTFGGASTDLVSYGSAASLDNLAAFTMVLWIYPTTLTTDRGIFNKYTSAGTGAGPRLGIHWGNSDELIFSNRRPDDTNDEVDTTGANITTNKWWCVACVYDNALGSNRCKIFLGSLTAAMAECSYDFNISNGTGALGDSAVSLEVGNTGAHDAPFQGRVAFTGFWNRAMVLGELKDQQFHPHKTSGCVLFSHLGFNGTSTQTDYSGSANHGTVTGATASGHVPLMTPFSPGDGWLPYAVSAPATAVKDMIGGGFIPFAR